MVILEVARFLQAVARVDDDVGLGIEPHAAMVSLWGREMRGSCTTFDGRAERAILVGHDRRLVDVLGGGRHDEEQGIE